MTCPRIWEFREVLGMFLEVVKRALEEPPSGEYCVYDRDMFGRFIRRPNPQIKKVYACGAYSEFRRTYRLFVVPGAAILQIINSGKFRCRVITDYGAVERHVKKRPHYEICIFREPVEFSDASFMCTS